MTSSERKLENKCVQHATEQGFRNVKLDLAARDWPDRQFFGDCGRSFLVEFKMPGQRPRPGQAKLHEDLEEMGYTVHVIDNYEDFTALVAQELHLIAFDRLRRGMRE